MVGLHVLEGLVGVEDALRVPIELGRADEPHAGHLLGAADGLLVEDVRAFDLGGGHNVAAQAGVAYDVADAPWMAVSGGSLASEHDAHGIQVTLDALQLPFMLSLVAADDPALGLARRGVLGGQVHHLEAQVGLARMALVLARCRQREQLPRHAAPARAFRAKPVPPRGVQRGHVILGEHAGVGDPDALHARELMGQQGDEVPGDREVAGVAGIGAVAQYEPTRRADAGDDDLGVTRVPVLVVALEPEGRVIHQPGPPALRVRNVEAAVGCFPGGVQSRDLRVVLAGFEVERGRVGEQNGLLLLGQEAPELVGEMVFERLPVVVEHVEGAVEVLNLPIRGLGEVGVPLHPAIAGVLALGVDDAVDHHGEDHTLEVELHAAFAGKRLQRAVDAQCLPGGFDQEAHAQVLGANHAQRSALGAQLARHLLDRGRVGLGSPALVGVLLQRANELGDHLGVEVFLVAQAGEHHRLRAPALGRLLDHIVGDAQIGRGLFALLLLPVATKIQAGVPPESQSTKR